MKKRHTVLALLSAVSVLTFLDRLAVPIAEPGIRADLHLSPTQWGWTLSAYVLANALFEIPSGALGDRNGQRLELTRITLWWSAFTALTGSCRTFVQITASRFLFGVGAAGAYPNAAGVIGRWFPRSEHARAQGFVWGFSRLGGALAPLLLVPIERLYGWHAIFYLLGTIGILWSAAWYTLFRNNPADTPNITAQELAEIGPPQSRTPIPWRRLLALPHLWLIVAAYFCYAWGSWFFFGWFTTWLVRGAGFTVPQMGLYASLPFLMGLAGNLIGGALTERLVLAHGPRRAHRWITATCLTATSALLLGMTLTHTHAAIIALATAGFGIMDLMLPAAWAMCMSLGGPFGGTATGLMNTAGNLGGWLCTVLFGYAVAATNNYNLPLQAIAAMVLLAALLFSRIDCTQGLADTRKTLDPPQTLSF